MNNMNNLNKSNNDSTNSPNNNNNNNRYREGGTHVGGQHTQHQQNVTFILTRWLPYSCTELENTKFFRIHRKAGGADAYVQFYTINDTDKAIKRYRVWFFFKCLFIYYVTFLFFIFLGVAFLFVDIRITLVKDM